MQKLKLFLLLCIITGILIVGGSVLGNGVKKTTGLFAGAVIGGLIGIVIAALIARHFSIIKKKALPVVAGMSAVGFGLAILISVYNLDSPVILVASTSLVGIGGVIGQGFHAKRAKEAKNAK